MLKVLLYNIVPSLTVVDVVHWSWVFKSHDVLLYILNNLVDDFVLFKRIYSIWVCKLNFNISYTKDYVCNQKLSMFELKIK